MSIIAKSLLSYASSMPLYDFSSVNHSHHLADLRFNNVISQNFFKILICKLFVFLLANVPICRTFNLGIGHLIVVRDQAFMQQFTNEHEHEFF